MGLRITFDRSERRVALAGGAWLTMRPANSVEIAAAEAAAARKLKEAMQGVGALAELGIDVPAADDLADGDYALGLSRYVAGVALAEILVSDWGGIFDEDDKALAFDPALLPRLFLEDSTLRRFEAAAYALRHALVAEGNGSAPLPSGSAAGAQPIARAANRSTRRAAAASRRKTASSARSAKAPKPPKE